MELPEEPIPEQGRVARVLDRVSTGRATPKEGGEAGPRGATGEDTRIKEKAAEMRVR